MKIVTGAIGELHVTSSDDGAHWAALWGDKEIVLKSNEMFDLEIETSNDIKVLSGDLMMQGRHGRIPYGEYDALEIANGTTGYLRNDIIACEYDESAGVETMELVVVQGTPVREGEEPADPDITKGDIMHNAATNQMPLWRIRLNGVNIEETEQMFEVEQNCTLDEDGNLFVDGEITAEGAINADGAIVSATNGGEAKVNGRRVVVSNPETGGSVELRANLQNANCGVYSELAGGWLLITNANQTTTVQDAGGTASVQMTSSGDQTMTSSGDQTMTSSGAQNITSSGAQNITSSGAQYLASTGRRTMRSDMNMMRPITSFGTESGMQAGRCFQIQAAASDTLTDADGTGNLLCGGSTTAGRYLQSGAAANSTSDSSANARITSSGVFQRYVSSSARYKHDISYLSNADKAPENELKQMAKTKTFDAKWEQDMRSILDIPVAKFRFNDGYVTCPPDYDNSQWVTGFIAEDIAEICPECCDYTEPDENDGEVVPESWNERKLIPRMLYVIQEQEKRITELEEKIEALSK